MRNVRGFRRSPATVVARLLVVTGALSSFSPAAGQTLTKPPAIHVATPTPAPPSRAMVQPAVHATTVGLPAPGALHYTTDVGACKRAGGDDGTCGALVTQNAVAFYFTWSCTGPDCTIAGFRLKDANRTASASMATVHVLGGGASDAIDTSTRPLFIVRPPSGGWAGRCYDVTAYRTPVAKLVPDGSGGLKPAGGTTGSYEESPPGAKACVGALTKLVELPAAKLRSFNRTYFFTVNTPHTTQDQAPTEYSWIWIGKETFSQPSFSYTNRFFRAAALFDAAPLGDVTVHGGRFAYDASKDCYPRLFTPAPGGWESASWVKAHGSPLAGTWGGGNPHVFDVSATVRGWRAPRKVSFFLQESLSEGLDAEAFNFDVGMMDACSTTGQNVRLLLDVGVTK